MSQPFYADENRRENPTASMAITIIFMALGMLASLSFLIAPTVAHKSEFRTNKSYVSTMAAE